MPSPCESRLRIAIYGPMIYSARYLMLLMRANLLRGQVGGVWALDIETFLGPVKWHQDVRQVPVGAQNSRDFQGPNSYHLSK
jgi:hypothetical protein